MTASLLSNAGEVIKYAVLGDYVKDNVPALSSFFSKRTKDDIPSLAALSRAMRLLQRCGCSRWLILLYVVFFFFLSESKVDLLLQFLSTSYEFKKNHGEWVSAVKPELGPGIAERVLATLQTTDEKIGVCLLVKEEFNAALAALIGVLFLFAS